jgi:DNA mismatch repair protein MutL
MESRIQPITHDLIQRMSAGTVIDSLAAVVSELIENALDAQATRLAIHLWPDDWRVQVTDNGIGLSLTDLRTAAQAHTTSKLSGDAPLCAIQTLGFRGEALHSLAQVAMLQIASRQREKSEGWCARFNSEGQPVAIRPLAIAPGTIVTVENLFAGWPNRRQLLPSPAQQTRQIQALIQSYALCHPHITWQVWRGESLWLSLAPGQQAVEIIPQILRNVHPSELWGGVRSLSPIPAESTSAIAANPEAFSGPERLSDNWVEVALGLPDRCHRYRPDWIRIAVNGRCVQVNGSPQSQAMLNPLEQVILSAFRQTLPRHRYPLCFLHLHLNPSYIDWHRHPAKTEIYLGGIDHWRSQLQAILQEALTLALPAQKTALLPPPVTALLRTAEGQGSYGLPPQRQLPNPDPAAEISATTVNLSDALPSEKPLAGLRAIAQLHQIYIVAEHPDGLWLVEQHIAHERVLYEALEQDWQLVPVTPPLRISHLSLDQVQRLEAIGLTLESFGPQTWVVRSLPHLLIEQTEREAILLELSHTDNLQAAMATIACRSAMRNGTRLTLAQMQRLLDQWQRTRQPRTCPHGRPIYLLLDAKNLARFFRRNWIVAKRPPSSTTRTGP